MQKQRRGEEERHKDMQRGIAVAGLSHLKNE
jgi:hypothetical protein